MDAEAADARSIPEAALSPGAEALRWFPLPGEVLAEMQRASDPDVARGAGV